MRRIRSGNRRAKNKVEKLVIKAFAIMNNKIVGEVSFYVKPWQWKACKAAGLDLKRDILNFGRPLDTDNTPEADEKAELKDGNRPLEG